jgi:DNA-binding response OmpR family regulator
MLAKGLSEQSYAVDVAPTGEHALYLAAITDYDAIVLDVMLVSPTVIRRSSTRCDRSSRPCRPDV